MKRSTILFFVTLLTGALALSLRGISLMREYDPATNLVSRSGVFHISLCVLSVLYCAAMYLLVPKRSGNASVAAGGQTMPLAWVSTELPAILALLGAAYCYFRKYVTAVDGGSLVQLIFALLTLFAAISMAIVMRQTVRGPLASGYGFYLTVPVFWGCFNLILDFWNHSGNPVLSDFIFPLLGYVSVALSMYYASSCFYLGKGQRYMRLFAYTGVYFSLLGLFGPMLGQMLISGELPHAAQTPLTRTFLLAFVLFHSLGLLWLAERGAFDRNYTEPPTHQEPEIIIPDVDDMLQEITPENLSSGLPVNLPRDEINSDELQKRVEAAEQELDNTSD